jgi:hypothetical protein
MSFYDRLLKRLEQLRSDPGYMMQLDLEVGRATNMKDYLLRGAQANAREEASHPTIKGVTLAQVRDIILRDEHRAARQ